MESSFLKENQKITGLGRNYGIDLLRLVLMFMVCMLHSLGQGGVIDASVKGTIEYDAYWFLEILSFCAVDGFAIISGYTANNRPQKYEKLVNMWFQAFFYSFIVTAILTVIGINKAWATEEIIKCAFPVTFVRFWYFTAFFALFFAMPIFNKIFFSISENLAKKSLIIIVVLFSILGTLYDPFGSSAGYSAIWLMVLYCVGILAKRIKLFETRKNTTLIVWWALCVGLTWSVHVFIGIRHLTSYVSPTILLSGIIMVVLFSRIPLKGKFISKLSPLAFGIYLFQLNQVIWYNVLKNAFVKVVEKPLYIGIPLIFGFASIIFLSGLCVEFVRGILANVCKINSLSKRIVEKADFMLEKLFVFLK